MEEKRENTDLIDVSNVAGGFDEETPAEESGSISNIGEIEEEAQAGFMIASLKDRFAAAVIDTIFLYFVYWFMMVAYRAIAFGEALGPIPAGGWHGLIFHGLFCLVAFLYFFLFEGIFFTSVGKLVCRLSVRAADGKQASLGGIFVRNLLRPVDILLFPIAIGFVILEKTGWHQRIGDLLGRTVVIRKLGSAKREYVLSLDILASASGRLGAHAIDALFCLVLFFGYVLLLNPESPLGSMLLIVFLPIVFFLYCFLPEVITATSIGKLVFGYIICQEDGKAIDASSAVTRTAARIFDTNIFGFLCILLSIRKQRPGDIAAGTVVCKAARQLKGLIGAAVVAVIVVIVFFAGLGNRNNVFSESFKINFLPALDFKMMGARLGGKAVKNLSVQGFFFAAGTPDQTRRPAIFEPGETIFLNFNLDGFKVQDGKAWIQEDLLVRYPDDSIGLKLENVIDFHEAVSSEEPIEFSNNLALPSAALPGRYTITLTLRDKNSDKELKEQRFFYVTAATSKAPPSPVGAAGPQAPVQPESPPAGPRTVFPAPPTH